MLSASRPRPRRAARPRGVSRARAGDDADELASLAEAFLRVVPPPEPSEDDVAVMRARLDGEPGLLALRRRHGRKVDEVVDELTERLEIDDRPRLRRYYQRLEGGVLDPHPVDERVWDALGRVFATSVRSLIRPLVTRQCGSATAYYRPSDRAQGPRLAERASAVEPAVRELDLRPGERDALDRLFLGDA